MSNVACDFQTLNLYKNIYKTKRFAADAGCKALIDIDNFVIDLSNWITNFKDGDVCETDSSGTYKVCDNGNCIDGTDPKEDDEED